MHRITRGVLSLFTYSNSHTRSLCHTIKPHFVVSTATSIKTLNLSSVTTVYRKYSSGMPPIGRSQKEQGPVTGSRFAAKQWYEFQVKILGVPACICYLGSQSSEADKAKEIFIKSQMPCSRVDIEKLEDYSTEATQQFLKSVHGAASLPAVFVKGNYVGGVADLEALASSGQLAKWMEPHDYDLIVIGGGSGGLAAAQEAAKYQKKVCVLDYVKPTPIGTSWGLGGTCVNVGCIPKKLMHQTALLGKAVKDARTFGWQLGSADDVTHNWNAMTKGVQDYIASLNWKYRVALREKNVTYKNSYGSFIDSHTIKAVNKKGKEEKITADSFLISTGLRPRYMDIPGAKEYCITSDDIFSLKYCPGKTLFVGASYVSLECAGFLHGIGLDTTVMVRSILLRGFDQDMANRIGDQMATDGVNFIHKAVPTKVTPFSWALAMYLLSVRDSSTVSDWIRLSWSARYCFVDSTRIWPIASGTRWRLTESTSFTKLSLLR